MTGFDGNKRMEMNAGTVTEMELEPELQEALGHFKQSVDAWSDAMLSRPRQVAQAADGPVWRAIAVWAMALVLMAGAASGGIYGVRQRIAENARIEHEKQVEMQKMEAQKRAVEEEELLATIDSDVSQAVPRAMEPLAQMVDDGDSR